MGAYLQSYGAGEEQRHAIIKRTIVGIVLGIILIAVLMLVFRNFSEKRQVSGFVNELQAGNWKAAYARFGCTDATPCPNYPFTKFMEDWGPNGPHKSYAGVETQPIRSCQTSLIEAVQWPSGDQVPLIVDRAAPHTIGFAPYPYGDLTRVPNWTFIERVRNWLGDLLHSC